MEFLNSLKKRSTQHQTPFDHWELNQPLTQEAISEICKTEITNLANMNINYDGTRAVDGGEGKLPHCVFNSHRICLITLTMIANVKET